jgi:WD40 repeat protein
VDWVDFSRDGRTLFTASPDRTVRVYDTVTGATRRILTLPGSSIGVGSIDVTTLCAVAETPV